MGNPVLAISLFAALVLGAGRTHAQAPPPSGPQSSPSSPAPASGQGQRPAGQGRFLNDRERGWHWYEVEPDPPEKPPEPEVAPAPAGPPPMSVPWLREEFKTATESAVENPTRENVEYWAYLKKILLDKSEKFAQMAMQVNELNPVLDETIQNPVQSATRNVAASQAKSNTRDILEKLAGEVGLIYFYKSDCSFCAQQNKSLDVLMRMHGFNVTAVSLDHKPFPSGEFPNWVPNSGQAQMLGVDQTPTLYLFKPPNQMVRLTVGNQVTSAMERRILNTAHRSGWIDKASFEKAVLGMERRFFLDKLTAPDGINWDDKAQALDALRALEGSALEESNLDPTQLGTQQGTPWDGAGQ